MAPSVTKPVPHRVAGVVPVMVGIGLIVATALAPLLKQLFKYDFTVYVVVAVMLGENEVSP